MYLVAGLGITGQSVLRYFQQMEEPCFAFDTRADLELAALKETFPTIPFAVGALPTEWLTKFDKVVLSPGIAQSEPWVEHLKALGKEIIGDIELFARAVGEPIIGVTGSNGKSTVTTLVGQFLMQAGYRVGIGGNIGTPALDLLMDDQDYEVYVLELSSFQLETTYSLETTASSVLNLSEDHMDRYDSFEAYIQAKTHLLDQTDLAVVPEDFHFLPMNHPQRLIRFGLQPPQQAGHYGRASFDQGDFLVRKNADGTLERLIAVPEMMIQTRHHQLNALAAMALTEPFELPLSVYQQVLKSFKGLPHRTQAVAEIDGVLWINDSKGTNVGATLAAIESFVPQAAERQGQVILIAGGVGKAADFTALQSAVLSCKSAILFGQDGPLIAQSLAQPWTDAQSTEKEKKMSKSPVLPSELKLEQVETLQQAVQKAFELAETGDIVLFSPACASFDQFANYAARGEAFERSVFALNKDASC